MTMQIFSDAMIPCANSPDPDACSQGPDEVSRPKRRCTENRMVVVDDSPRRRTMNVFNHEEFKNFPA